MRFGEHIISLNESLADEYSTDLLKEKLGKAEKVLARTLWFSNEFIQPHKELVYPYDSIAKRSNLPADAIWTKGDAFEGKQRTFVEIPPDPNTLPENLKHRFNNHLNPHNYDYLNSLTEIETLIEDTLLAICTWDMDSHLNLHLGEWARGKYLSDNQHKKERFHEFTSFVDNKELLKSWVDLMSSDVDFEKLHSWFEENKVKKDFEGATLSLDVNDTVPIIGADKNKEVKNFSKTRFIFRIVGVKEDKTKRRLALYTAYPIEEIK